MNSKLKKCAVLIFILIVILIIATCVYNYLKTRYDVEEVLEEMYLISMQNDKVGVVDNEKNVIIEPQYFKIQIPNPSKAIFVCFYDYNE